LTFCAKIAHFQAKNMDKDKKKRLAVLASGSGSNAENIIRYFKNHPKAEVVLLVSNKADAFALQRAKNLNVPAYVVPKFGFENGEALQLFQYYEADFLILAGFLLKAPQNLLEAYPDRIVNIHPALLPKYGGKGMYGMHVHEAVVAHRETESGITIHYVNEEYDAGKVIFQAKCDVLPDDTPDDVAAKVHALEYAHFPSVIEQVVTTF